MSHSGLLSKDEVVSAIFDVLRNTLSWPHLDAFSPDARLNEELYLDSVVVLQLLVQLELQLGFEIPEDELSAEHFDSVSTLADLLMTLPRTAVGEQGAA